MHVHAQFGGSKSTHALSRPVAGLTRSPQSISPSLCSAYCKTSAMLDESPVGKSMGLITPNIHRAPSPENMSN